MIKIFEMFAGYGGASFALKKANIDFECVGFSEIDKYAVQCYEQNHNLGHRPLNKGNCLNINPNEIEDFDLLTGGFPCQSFSVAGKGLGELDTRGTLFNEIIRIAEIKKPKYMVLENVKGLTNKNHKATFNKILSELHRIGYNVNWKVLNSKEHGIPQNRERVFFVCIRNDLVNDFQFPQKEELKIFLKDILENEVDDKYYLKQEQLDKVLKSTFSSRRALYQGDKKICSCLAARDYKEPKIVQVGMMKQTCQKRIFETPKEINQYLKDHKGYYTIKEISEYIEIPKTQVEHYFRTDQSRAIPDILTWFELKKLLGFDETWDTEVATTHEKEIEFESTRRVYSDEGCSPTISSTNADKLIQINNPKHSNDRVYSDKGISPTLNTMQGGDRQPFIVASRGRNIGNPSDRTSGADVEQRLEPKFDGTTNTISTVQKDNYVCILQRPHGANKGGERAKDGVCPSITSGASWENNNYLKEDMTIRKLTPTECFRLMGFLDDGINLEGLSNTQRYKLAGNGWDINLVSKIFTSLFHGDKKHE